MSNLGLDSIELTTSLRTAPKNGAPSSHDYNASQKEVLADLANIVTFINESVLTILNALPSTAAAGLSGETLYAAPGSDESLFIGGDSAALTVSDVLRKLTTVNQDISRRVDEINSGLQILRQRLATTNQNDLRNSLQSLQDLVRGMNDSLSGLASTVSSLNTDKLKYRTGAEPFTNLSATANVDLQFTFNPAFGSNAYMVFVSSDVLNPADLQVRSITRNGSGQGVTVNVKNLSGSALTGNVHVLAKAL